MDTLNSCHMCVKVSFDLHSQNMIGNISEMPNTFDVVSGKYEWKQFGLMSYAIVPQSFRSNTARVDILVCMDEDDLDDIDLKSYVSVMEYPCRAGRDIPLLSPMIRSIQCRAISDA